MVPRLYDAYFLRNLDFYRHKKMGVCGNIIRNDKNQINGFNVTLHITPEAAVQVAVPPQTGDHFYFP